MLGDKDKRVEDYQLLIDLHKGTNRQGPGGDAETELAIGLSMIDRSAPLKIADIGCVTGASTLVLAKQLNAQITAVDFFQDFLDVLENRAQNLGLSQKYRPFAAQWIICPLEIGNLILSGLKERYTILVSKEGKGLEPLSEIGRTISCFGDHLDYRFTSAGTSKILG